MSNSNWGGPVEPMAAYRDYQRQRQMTLGDLLLENRIILFLFRLELFCQHNSQSNIRKLRRVVSKAN